MNETIIRQNQSEHIDKLATALSEAQSVLKPAKKSGFNPHFKSHFATLEDIFNAAQLVLPDFGLSMIQPTEFINGQTFVRTVLMHGPSGQWVDGLYPVVTQKNDPQGLGSGMSYSRRYAAMAMIGLPAEDDDSENATNRPDHNQNQNNQDPANLRLGKGMDTVADGYISDKQAKRLFAIAKKHNVSNEQIKGILKKYGIEETKQIRWKDYDSIIVLIEAASFNPADWEPTNAPA